MVLFESLGTVSYSHSIANMVASLSVSTQCTNVTDTARRHRAAKTTFCYIFTQQELSSATARRSSKWWTQQTSSRLLHCTVLPPGELNGIIREQSVV